MKKTLLFVSCALFLAGMTACNNNAEAPVEDTEAVEVVEETVAEEETAEATVAEADATADAAMLSAAREAGQAKCNCYKKDAASVEACIRAILSEKYADYKDNAAFKKAMEDEFNKCVKEKATAAAKEAGDKAVKAGAQALSNKLQGKN